VSELRCPCGGSYGETVVAQPGYALRRCVGCGLLGMDPRTAEGDGDYAAAYFEKNYLARAAHWREANRHWSRRVLTPLGGPGTRLLDVGCGLGLLLSVAPPGWIAVGLEPGEGAAELARRELGVQVRRQHLETLDPAERFDVITFFDVIEHLVDPIAALRRAAAHLSPGGAIVVKVPDISARALRAARLLARFGRAGVVLHPGSHLYQFDATTLRATMDRAGLRVEQLASHPSPRAYRAFFIEGRLVGRLARLGLTLAGADHTLVAVARLAV
jgi:2-polyprenyl-3-methyl-5-hydroxy-6-metoxy-1,4-benzoquinol methylase